MSFLERNEYLLEEIDYYHSQICSRLTEELWSENYRHIWNNVCVQLGWHDLLPSDGAGDRVARILLRHTAHGRQWVFDSPVLQGAVGLSRTESITCRTIFGFDLITTGLGSWEPLAHGMCEPGETLLVMRLLPYFEYFLDVGAGNGYFTFLAAQHGVDVTAFEPSPTLYQQLTAGLALNGFSNIVAPQCSAGVSAAGGVFYLEDGPPVKPLSLAEYRANSTLVRLAAAEGENSLRQGTEDWLQGYDAPAVLVTTGEETGEGTSGTPSVIRELAKYDYRVFPINRRPGHGASLLTAAGSGGQSMPVSYLALPPMAHDLAAQLSRLVDMRVFTPTVKLENLYFFVKSAFEEL